MNWLPLPCATLACLLAQQPVPPNISGIEAYVRKIDSDKTLTIFRYMQTYGHPLTPSRDSIFWCGSDFPSSAIFYYSAGKIVKVIETSRDGIRFCENSYYLRNSKLLFVRERQVYCPLEKQRAIWFKQALACSNEKDCFFRGSYYFEQDSCIAKQERGEVRFQPEDYPNYRYGVLSPFFPWQAARYLAVFGKNPAATKKPR